MRTILQRVGRAQISDKDAYNSQPLASIGKGMVLLVGFEASDTPLCLEQMAQKIRSLRIFSDAEGKMNIAGPESNAEYLVVSQFTLYADCRYGNRPSFEGAAPKAQAKDLYERFVQTFARLVGNDRVKHGPFGSDLNVELTNDGPVTIWLNSKEIL